MREQTGLRKMCTLVISGSAYKVNDLVWLSSKNGTATSIHIIYVMRKGFTGETVVRRLCDEGQKSQQQEHE